MRGSLGRWLVAVAALLGAAACAEGAAPPVSHSPKRWTGVIDAHGGYAYGVAVSPDGGTLLTTGDREAALWDLRTGRLLRRRSWEGSTGRVFYPVFVSGGKEVACQYRNEVLLLDART